MELKGSKYSYINHLKHELKTKKGWFLISAVILTITNILLPTILQIGVANAVKQSYGETFFIFGIIEMFILVFLSCMIDFSFLHSDSRLSYYLSKPVSLKNQIYVKIASNMILITLLILLSFISIAYHNLTSEVYDIFKIIIPWLIVGVLIASLSSILSGNTIMAGALTLFNFLLPAVFYLVLLFVFSIIEDTVLGFDRNVLKNLISMKYYNVEFIYLFEYLEKSIDINYVLMIIGVIALLIVLTTITITKRKNENVGNFIIFNNYKYFASFILSLIFPAVFALSANDITIVSKIIVSSILAALSYYVVTSIIEKSLKISFYSMRVFAICVLIFIIITGSTVFVAYQNKDVVPQASEVKMAYVGYNSNVIKRVEVQNNQDLDNVKIGDIKYKNNISLLKEKENIENAIELHKELLQNQGYKHGGNVVIAYWLNDGTYLIRNYDLKSHNDKSAEKVAEKKDLIAKKILNTQELKKSKYYYLYDESYFKDKKIYVDITNEWKSREDKKLIENMDLSEIREYLKKDIDKKYLEPIQDNIALEMLLYGHDVAEKYAEPVPTETQINAESNPTQYYIQVFEKAEKTENSIEKIYTLVLDDMIVDSSFKNTFEYINSKTK